MGDMGGSNSIRKASHYVQLEVTENQDHKVCGQVCTIQQGAWQFADGRVFGHHVCHVISLPQIPTPETSFKIITCETQHAESLFRVGNSAF
jgi:hypothetical protein